MVTTGLTIPPELKKINQFIRRAEELDNDTTRPESRLVAYYCRQYAVTVGIPYGNTPSAKKCLSLILNELESEKSAMSSFTKYEAEYLIRKFANVVFNRADEEDRNGLSNRTTAKTFYAAATFYEVLQQFYNSSEDNEEKKELRDEDVNKRKYSKWKATEILKAMKEGNTVTPGGYGEMEAVKEHMKQQQQEETTPAEVVEPSTATEDPALGLLPPPAPTAPASSSFTNGSSSNSSTIKPLRTSILGSDDNYNDNSTGMNEDTGIEVVRNASNSFRDTPNDEDEIPVVVLPPPPSYAAPPLPPTTSNNDKEQRPYSPTKKQSFASSIAESVTSAMKKTLFVNMTGEINKNDIDDAIELSRFAIVALQSNDVELGCHRIMEALGCLGKSTQPMTSSYPKSTNVTKCIEQIEKSINYLRKNDTSEGEKRLASALALLR